MRPSDFKLTTTEGNLYLCSRCLPITLAERVGAYFFIAASVENLICRYKQGRPKGVLHTQRQVMTNAARAVDTCKLTSRDVWFHAAPMFHAMGKDRGQRGTGIARTITKAKTELIRKILPRKKIITSSFYTLHTPFSLVHRRYPELSFASLFLTHFIVHRI